MFCFISRASLLAKIHIGGNSFGTPLVNLNKIFYLQKTHFTVALCFLKYYIIYVHIYRVIQKDGLNFLRLYFLNYAWYVSDLHGI